MLRGDNRTCDDVNECSANPCGHTCVNLPGSFRCECEVGYFLDENGTSCRGQSTIILGLWTGMNSSNAV